MDSHKIALCRLCFFEKTHLINIFNDEFELNRNVAAIINEHIGEVSDSDALPKSLCIECWNTIETFHKFHRSVKSAQANYLKQLVKCELEAAEDVIGSFDNDSNDFALTHFVDLVHVKCDEMHLDFETTTKNAAYTSDLTMESIPRAANDEVSTSENPFKDGIDRWLQGDSNRSQYEFDNDLGENVLETSTGSSNIHCDSLNTVDSSVVHDIIAKNFDFSCDVCQIDLKSLERAIVHYKNEHGIQEGYIKCCGFKLKRQSLIDDHIQLHLNPDIFKCEYCSSLMKTRAYLKRHVYTFHEKKRFICDFCGKIWRQRDQIEAHLKRHVNTFVCQVCQQRYSCKERLMAHERLEHNPDTPARIRSQLDALNEMTSTPLSASETEQIMFKQFDMTCDICGDGLRSLQQAQFHYMHEHQIPDGYIKCCGTKFEKLQSVNGHIIHHTNPELFKCNVCNKVELTVEALRNHLLAHMQLAEKIHDCVECNRAFTSKAHLARHMQNLHGISTVSKYFSFKTMVAEMATVCSTQQNDASVNEFFDMTCDMCNVILASLQHAKLHYLDEHGVSDGYIKCCGFKFKELKQVNYHLKYHRNSDIYKCNKCGKTYSRKRTLMEHLKQHLALETKQYTCAMCGKMCKTKQQLDAHETSHDKSKRTFPCEFCSKRFTTKKEQTSHQQRIHLKDQQKKTEICEFCARTFSKRSEVLCHIRSQHSNDLTPRERVQCNVCGAWLSSRYVLKEHLLRHSAEPQKCPQCDRISPNKAALKCHIREVHTERIHKCQFCDKSFKTTIALKDHVATHTGEKMYKCKFCEMSFTWRPNMYNHQKKAHPEKSKPDKKKIRAK